MTSKYDPPTTPARTTRGGERLDAGLQVAELRDRKLRVLDAEATGALPDVDQPVLIAVDERAQKHAADDAEDRRVGANPEREGHDDRDRQTFHAVQRSQSEAEISEQAHMKVVERAGANSTVRLQSYYSPTSVSRTSVSRTTVRLESVGL